MIFELARRRKFIGVQLVYNCLGTTGLIVAPWKFDILKTSKFPRGNYQPIVPARNTLLFK